MSTEILQETRTRMYKHANRPVPLQNIRLNFTENPYHRVIRGNTYNLRTTSSGLVRLNTHLSTPQHIQRQHLYFPPVHQAPHQQQATPIRHTPKKVWKTMLHVLCDIFKPIFSLAKRPKPAEGSHCHARPR